MAKKKTTTDLLALSPGQLNLKRDELHECEQNIRDAAGRVYEDFYYVGQQLKRIKDGMLFLGEGFGSFKKYCQSGRLEYKQSYAYSVIAASDFREALPDLPHRGEGQPVDAGWSESTVCPLTKLANRNSAARVAKKICTHLKRNPEERLTAPLVKKFVDADLGVPEKKAAKKLEDLESATPGNALLELLKLTRKHNRFLESVEAEFWTEAEKAIPGIVKRLTTAFDQFASFLRS